MDAFRIGDHIPAFDMEVSECQHLSVQTRDKLRMIPDVAYGPTPRQKLDIFFPASGGEDLPVHMFVHGGYWRMFSKDDFSHVANTVTAAGAIAVIINFDLMPSVGLAEVVRQVRRARDWIVENIGQYGGDARRLTVSGHSTGAHLATFLFTEDEKAPPRGSLLLGGVYNIQALQQSFLQPLVQLTDEEVREFSPLQRNFLPRVDSFILYGEQEAQSGHAQGGALAWQLKEAGCDVVLAALSDAGHMSSIVDLGSPESEAGQYLCSLIARY